jgi:hypothetical protein
MEPEPEPEPEPVAGTGAGQDWTGSTTLDPSYDTYRIHNINATGEYIVLSN